MKFLWFDTETTGLDPILHDIIQISGIIETNSSREDFNIKIAPTRYDTISQQAIRTHGIPIKEMRTYQSAADGYKEIKTLFNKYVDCYNPEDKFIPCGQNIDFDLRMLNKLFKYNDDQYLFSYIIGGHLDLKIMAVLYEMAERRKIFKNYKLSTICEEFKIPLAAHDAYNDIHATRKCCLLIWNRINAGGNING